MYYVQRCWKTLHLSRLFTLTIRISIWPIISFPFSSHINVCQKRGSVRVQRISFPDIIYLSFNPHEDPSVFNTPLVHSSTPGVSNTLVRWLHVSFFSIFRYEDIFSRGVFFPLEWSSILINMSWRPLIWTIFIFADASSLTVCTKNVTPIKFSGHF